MAMIDGNNRSDWKDPFWCQHDKEAKQGRVTTMMVYIQYIMLYIIPVSLSSFEIVLNNFFLLTCKSDTSMQLT